MRFRVLLDGVPARAKLAAEPEPGVVFQVTAGPLARVTHVDSHADGSRVISAKRIGPATDVPGSRENP